MEKIYSVILLFSIMASDCFLHYESVDKDKKVSTVTAKGAAAIKRSLELHRNQTDLEESIHANAVRNIDQHHEAYPWKNSKFHEECRKKFTKVRLKNLMNIFLLSLPKTRFGNN